MTLWPIRISLVVACLACQDTSWQQHSSVAIDTLSSGAIVVNNNDQGIWQDRDVWILNERLRLGRLDGDGPEVFGRVSGLTLDVDGRIYVYDGQARELRIFDGDGTIFEVVGRQGAGPQEFNAVVGLTWTPDGSLWLVDAGNGRYAQYNPPGSIETVRRPIGVYTLPWLGGWAKDGRFFDTARITGGESSSSVLISMSSPGHAIDSVVLPEVDIPAPNMGDMTFPLPFAARQIWAFDPEGRIWTAVSSDYVLTALDLSGDTVAIVRRDHERSLLTQVQQYSVATYARNLTSRFGVEVPSQTIPNKAPVLQWMTVDDSSYLWVCSKSQTPCDSLDVFDSGGVYLGAVTLPTPVVGPPVIRGRLLLLASEGASGEPVVVLYDVVGRGAL